MVASTAVIMAAGRGVRMGPRGELTPKGLLDLGGVRLVERSVDLLTKAGFTSIRIVTGHLSEQYQSMFGATENVELLHNPSYAETGSLHSMLIGLDGLEDLGGGVVLLESDVVYEARALDPVATGETAIVLSGTTNATDEVYVWGTSDGARPRFETMSKDPDFRPETHVGELVGITGISATDFPALMDAAQTRFTEDRTSDYEPGIIKMAQAITLPCHLIEDLAWSEIDDEPMLAHAKVDIWPVILERDG